MNESVRELMAELAQVEDEIRALHGRGGGVPGRTGSSAPGGTWFPAADTELRTLYEREKDLCRALGEFEVAHRGGDVTT
jgi:hypothetical protein